jgi:hypothetical protein
MAGVPNDKEALTQRMPPRPSLACELLDLIGRRGEGRFDERLRGLPKFRIPESYESSHDHSCGAVALSSVLKLFLLVGQQDTTSSASVQSLRNKKGGDTEG